jgi:membrane protein
VVIVDTVDSSGTASSQAALPERDSSPQWGTAWTIFQRHLRENGLFLRTSALTYATLLSAVPFLAVLLSVVRALGIEDKVFPWLIEHLRLGGSQAAGEMVALVHRMNPAALGLVGGLLLVATSMMLLAQVDSAFNVIWGARESRSLPTRILSYGGLLVLGPLWIALWTTIVSTARVTVSSWPPEWSLIGFTLVRVAGPLVGLCVLTALYLVTPNTRVRLTSALAGAVLAIALLELFQIVFPIWVKSAVGYSIVYGKFAALPIYLAWIYFNWLAVLIGAEAGYLVQNVPAWLRESEEPGNLAWDERERLALAAAAMLVVCGEMEPEALAEALEVSPRLVHAPLDDLMDAGWLEPITDPKGAGQTGYRAKPGLAAATLAEVRRSVRALGEESSDGSRQRALPAPPRWMATLEPLERESDRAFESHTLLGLARELAQTSPAVAKRFALASASFPSPEDACRDSRASARSASG